LPAVAHPETHQVDQADEYRLVRETMASEVSNRDETMILDWASGKQVVEISREAGIPHTTGSFFIREAIGWLKHTLWPHRRLAYA
jgi:hypothetical protein